MTSAISHNAAFSVAAKCTTSFNFLMGSGRFRDGTISATTKGTAGIRLLICVKLSEHIICLLARSNPACNGKGTKTHSQSLHEVTREGRGYGWRDVLVNDLGEM